MKALRQPRQHRFENREGAPAIECISVHGAKKGWNALSAEEINQRVSGKTFGTFTVLDEPLQKRRRRTRQGFDYFIACRCSCGTRRWYRLDTIFRTDGSPASTQPNMCRQCYRVLAKRRR